MPSFLPGALLPLHELPIYSKDISVSQELWHYFCSCRVSNKINLFQDSKCTLQKCLTESLQKSIFLSKEPFSFFLHFCSVPPYHKQHQQSIFCLECKVHLHSLQAWDTVFKGNTMNSSWNSFLHLWLLLLNWGPVYQVFHECATTESVHQMLT